MYKVYGDLLSGNCYKVKLLMALLDIKHEWLHVDVLSGESKTPEFLKKNPNAKIPVMQIDESKFLSESNAILNYLAEDTPFVPQTRFERAQVLQWQFFEQYSHEPYVAVARFINKYLGLPEEKREEYESKQSGGKKALQVMDEQLGNSRFIVGDSPTIADISLYAYTHVAHEGGFDLSSYGNINNWLVRIESLPGYMAMPKTHDE